MIGEGEVAPRFELPAVVDGEFTSVALADSLGEEIVVLAFYPSDFNPACSGESTGLDELDPFTMQKDLTILGISADSLDSHRAFAAEYDLKLPLLSDPRGEIAAEYGVAAGDDSAGRLTRRAVVVVDPDGEVEYAWAAETPRQLPNVDEVRRAVEGIGGADTARARYQVGHAHYVEGRRLFTSAMGEFREREWILAQGDFQQAHEEFAAAADGFDTAERFTEDGTRLPAYERATRKARALGQAAEWLAEAASAYASGEGGRAEGLRRDAERPLETARAIDEPPRPDDVPSEIPDAPARDGDKPADADDAASALDAALADESRESDGEPAASESTDGPPESQQSTGDGADIDDAELAAITAELEAQTGSSEAADDSGSVVPDQPVDATDEDGEREDELAGARDE
jgi:peroxiredoxin